METKRDQRGKQQHHITAHESRVLRVDQYRHCHCRNIWKGRRWRWRQVSDLLMPRNAYEALSAIQMELYYVSSKDNDQGLRRISNVLGPSNVHHHHQYQALSTIQMELYYKFLINNLDYNHHLVLLLSVNAFWYENVCQYLHYHYHHPWWHYSHAYHCPPQQQYKSKN